MSFFDLLKNMGLAQGGQQQSPYGLPPEAIAQARWSALSNIGTQLMALGQQMTPDQRARMLQNADFSGGYQSSLYNAAQMKLMSDAARKRQLEQDQTLKAQEQIAAQIKALPPGKLRDAAMFYLQSGDLTKAAEVIWTQKKQFDPNTGMDVNVDYFGNPMTGGSSPLIGPSVAPLPAAGGGVSAAPASAVVPPPTGAPQPSVMPAVAPVPEGGGVDQLTTNWRRLLQDPSLTPAEARIISSQGSREAAFKMYQDIVKQRQDAANKDEDQETTTLNQNRGAADKIKSDFETVAKGYSTVIQAAQIGEQIAMDPNKTPADKLAVLYQSIKTLDPMGSVREGDIELAQTLQSWIGRLNQMYDSATNGGMVSDAMVQDLARMMGRLGTDARGRMERARLEAMRIAGARKVPRDMVFGPAVPGPAIYPQPPIGLRIPRAAQTAGGDPYTPDVANDLVTYGGQ